MTRTQAAQANCRTFAESRHLKARQLEEQIRASDATPAQRVDMMHTLSKLLMFTADEFDHLTRAASPENSYRLWLTKDTQ